MKTLGDRPRRFSLRTTTEFLSENQTGLIEIIHGYGSTGEGGTIRTRLRKFLERHSALLEYQIGEDVDDNMGHTFIHPVEPTPQ